VLFVPVFYGVCESIGERWRRPGAARGVGGV
jgi:hypothetical protein